MRVPELAGCFVALQRIGCQRWRLQHLSLAFPHGAHPRACCLVGPPGPAPPARECALRRRRAALTPTPLPEGEGLENRGRTLRRGGGRPSPQPLSRGERGLRFAAPDIARTAALTPTPLPEGEGLEICNSGHCANGRPHLSGRERGLRFAAPLRERPPSPVREGKGLEICSSVAQTAALTCPGGKGA